MKRIKFLLMLLTVILSTSFFISNCEKKPTAPVRNNPQDAKGNNYVGRAPVAAFTVTPFNGDRSTTFTFDASGCSDFDESTSSLQVRWDWENDGNYDTPYSTTKTATHKYSTDGTKTAVLEVKDSSGLIATNSNQIIVESHAPVASFFVSPLIGEINTVFSFDASSSTDADENTNTLQVRWDWDSDGSYDTNYSTTKIATHLYSDHGTKNIILQVKDSSGLTDTTKQQVKINDPYEGMVHVAAGSFQMGSNSGGSDEKPVHTVYLDAFYIDKYEVTNSKYVAYLDLALVAGEIQANSSSVSKGNNELLNLDDVDCQISYTGGTLIVDSGKENYPVIEVTWYGAKAYTDFYGKRLPTEAEWEYAARGGNLSYDYTYSGSNNVDYVAWYWSNSESSTHPVGQKQGNELEIYDLSGNVWEWCNDWYESDYYRNSPTNNPAGPTTGTSRVLRGGSWTTNAYVLRSTYRGYSSDPTSTSNSIGFRCVR